MSKRKSTPRTRTGCQTCRTRKIRCDETSPACQNCVRSGWTCPGYSDTQTASEAAATTSNIAIYRLPNTVPGSQQDRKALHYFSVSAAADIGGYFSADFWSRSILLRCQHDAPVRHAVAALSCVHREYVTSNVQAAFEASCEAVSAYVRSMKALRRYLKREMLPDFRVVMMCCAAFFCFELIRGEQGAALMHLQSGVSVLQQWQQGSLACTSGAMAVQETDRSQLVDVFARMDLQASAFDDGLALTARRSRLDPGVVADRLSDPSACSGPGLHAAKYSMLLRRCFHFLVESAPWRQSSFVEVDTAVLSIRDCLIVELKEWNDHLHGVSTADCEAERSLYLKSAIARSRFHCIIIGSLIQGCVPSSSASSSGTAADFEHKADDLIDLAYEAIGASSEPGTASLSGVPSKRHFCLHLGIVAPLFLLALKTSRADVVTSCLELLRRCKGRREGLYDANVIARVIEALMKQGKGVDGCSLLDQMGCDTVSRLHEAVESVVPTKDDGARRVRGLCRLLALVG